ncbi:MAG: hypothetical protein OEV85_04140 [Candidatus Thorarchaeota archaeon]|nr:hypothetical protein [Candidatus Thorarchaeota archaeon]
MTQMIDFQSDVVGKENLFIVRFRSVYGLDDDLLGKALGITNLSISSKHARAEKPNSPVTI